MAELGNSKRTLNRATYTPIKPDKKPGGRPPRRALDKWSGLAAMRIAAIELPDLRKALSRNKAALAVLEVVEVAGATTAGPTASGNLGALPQLAQADPAHIVQVGQALLALRQRKAQEVEKAARTLESHMQGSMDSKPQGIKVTAASLGKAYKVDATFINERFPGAALFRKTATLKATASGSAAARAAAMGTVLQEHVVMQLPQDYEATLPLPVNALPMQMQHLAQVAGSSAQGRQAYEVVQAVAQSFFPGANLQSLSLKTVPAAALASIQVAKDALFAFGKRLEIEPVGYLHLERIGFTPVGIERGELVYSVPLSPKEEVNITHKEWSNTSEEFERIVTDYLETFSEEGVTEKSELSQATASQQQHSSGFNMSVTASGGYGPVSISASAGYNASDSASSSQQFARNQSNEFTRKASSRTKKEHKVSFKVASASGAEDQAVRKIVNPFDRATRADYYQLIRKWQVDLFRYGIRLTYDVTLPEPGSDILSKIVEIREIQTALGQGFGASGSTQPWARFDLQPTMLSRSNYQALAATYGVAIEPPPAAEVRIVRGFSRQWSSFDESKRAENTSYDIEVPQDYFVSSVQTELPNSWWEGKDHHCFLNTDVGRWINASGRLTITVFSWQLSAFTLDVVVVAHLKTEVFQSWQMRAWGSLRDAAQARYESNRANLKSRLAQLQEELGAQDALSLRKIEREEVSKGVLRWIFGPDFHFVPPGVPANLYGSGQTVATPDIWAKVMAQGEIIKFLHHAIEWENMLYFLYPYFWSHTSRWELKKYLDHPDFMHRTFLRAGSARVVLTIRPGFEKDFMAFIDGGVLGASATEHYLTIAQEMEAYAKTNYPGIRPANPVEDARPQLTPLQRRAWDEMQAIMRALYRFRDDRGSYPTTAQGLAALASYGPLAANDPWGNAYVYQSPGKVSDYDLSSLGADGEPGGEGEDADIHSAADATLIGRWHEYTPTSALDIAFDDTLPSA
jgi:hypothetical protein